ncbi:hypothetical protein ACET3Z_001744 [Daucus carota]
MKEYETGLTVVSSRKASSIHLKKSSSRSLKRHLKLLRTVQNNDSQLLAAAVWALVNLNSYSSPGAFARAVQSLQPMLVGR